MVVIHPFGNVRIPLFPYVLGSGRLAVSVQPFGLFLLSNNIDDFPRVIVPEFVQYLFAVTAVIEFLFIEPSIPRTWRITEFVASPVDSLTTVFRLSGRRQIIP